ncbi:MAG: SRPBCC family protein [Mizugakiibacter sp.]|uniref:SRPBCC family protein n=1 Tax=Mizugakiibacter sp. TaxID=1972610 RepID=UPI0031BC45D0|nr:SRPBCC family protein [Xanthomonadaceae bacterium]
MPSRTLSLGTALAILASSGATAMSYASGSQTRSFTLPAPCARVFPYFTAEGERRWAPGWAPEMLSGDRERGSTFRTRAPDGRVSTWIVSAYEPAAHRVSYARLAEGSNIGLVDVHCEPANGGHARISVTYTLTALGAGGDAYVRAFLDDAAYAAFIGEWEQALGAALAREVR